jgi:hypothetical protein
MRKAARPAIRFARTALTVTAYIGGLAVTARTLLFLPGIPQRNRRGALRPLSVAAAWQTAYIVLTSAKLVNCKRKCPSLVC